MSKLNIAFVATTPSGIVDYSRYGTMSRLQYIANQAARGAYNVLKNHNWTQIAFVADVIYGVFAAQFKQLFAGENYTEDV